MNLFAKNRGFTLIELLVVIAIIGILSSVVLASLNTARNKGRDGAIKSSMQTIRVQSELYYDDNGNTYGTASGTGCSAGMYGDSTVAAAVTQIQGELPSGGTLTCNAADQDWAVQASLNITTGGAYWCADSSGQAIQTGNALGTNTTCS